MSVAEGAQKYQAQYSQASVEVCEPVELYEPQETQQTRRGQALPFFPRSRTAPQFPHVHSTVGLGASSTGGAVGTPSMSGAGTTLRVFCGRANISQRCNEFPTNNQFNFSHAEHPCAPFINVQHQRTE